MAPRSNWKGYLKLSLVSCPVQLFPATSSKERVAFHLLNRTTGNRLKRRLVDPETESEVDADEQVKGFQVGKNEYVLVEEDEIGEVAIESSHTIDIETFVPRDEVDSAYLDTPYYLAPDGKMGEEAFGVIREAMRAKKVVGIGRVVLYRRERPIMLEPRGRGLVATTLHYGYEVRDDADYFEDIDETEVPDEMLDLATHIIGRKMAHFDPKRFEDRYQEALLELIKAKQQHRPVTKPTAQAKGSNVVSLMDALRKSIAAGQEGGSPAKPAKAATKPAAKSTATKPTKVAAKQVGSDDAVKAPSPPRTSASAKSARTSARSLRKAG